MNFKKLILENFKISALLILFVVTSCDTEVDIQPELTDADISTDMDKQSGRFVFQNVDEFQSLYLKFAKMDVEELQSMSFYNPETESQLSPAILGILNPDNEFVLDGNIIWYDGGRFYELENDSAIDSQKADKSKLKAVGSLTNTG